MRAALDDRLGFLGTSGSGKTYGVGTAVEVLIHNEKARVVIIDPLGVWWGIAPPRRWQEGFGLEGRDFRRRARRFAAHRACRRVDRRNRGIDVREFHHRLEQLASRAAERRFMAAFLETIYRKAGGEPFPLIVDEADLFAPQKPAVAIKPCSATCIVRLGRLKGFIPG